MAIGGTADKNHMRPNKHFLPITSIQKYFQPAGHHVGDLHTPPDPSECSSLVQRACLFNIHNREIIMNHVLSHLRHFAGVYFRLDCNGEISFFGFVGDLTAVPQVATGRIHHAAILAPSVSSAQSSQTDRQTDSLTEQEQFFRLPNTLLGSFAVVRLIDVTAHRCYHPNSQVRCPPDHPPTPLFLCACAGKVLIVLQPGGTSSTFTHDFTR